MVRRGDSAPLRTFAGIRLKRKEGATRHSEKSTHTGISGQDGSYLAEMLLAKGYEKMKRRQSRKAILPEVRKSDVTRQHRFTPTVADRTSRSFATLRNSS